jgi:3'(2'), 5'-bisphosphate nucleotidase
VLGVVGAPALGRRLYAGVVGQGAWVEDAQGRRAIHARTVPAEGPDRGGQPFARRRRRAGPLPAGRVVAQLANAGSSLKLCLIAAGEADLYPRLGRTMEWDIAAGHAVLAAAGGQCDAVGRQRLQLRQAGLREPALRGLGAPARRLNGPASGGQRRLGLWRRHLCVARVQHRHRMGMPLLDDAVELLPVEQADALQRRVEA